VWIKLVRGIRHYTPEARFTTWLYRVVTHAAIDHLRKRARDAQVPDAGADGEPGVEAVAAPRLDPLDQELEYLRRRIAAELERAERALAESNAARARCFHLYYLREMTVRDISDALRLSEGTVKSHLFYCRRFIAENHPLLGELHLAIEERLGKYDGNRVY
jgi:RNA polymerase sigma-70 factor (ECF subfamily)